MKRAARLSVRFFQMAFREGLRAALRRVAFKLARRLAALSGTDSALAGLQAQLEAQHRVEQQAAGHAAAIVEELRQDLSTLKASHQRHGAELARRGAELADSVRRMALLYGNVASAPPASLRVSVVMPVYNRAHPARAAIESVLSQQGVAFELIVVDDGSTDGLEEAVRPYQSHPSFRFVQVIHGGQSRARNIGIEASSGEVVAYLDSDNLMLPGYLRILAAAYEAAPDAQCAMAAILWDDGGMGVHLRQDPFDWDLLLANQKANLDTNAFSHRRGLCGLLGGWDESMARHADFELVLRYTRHNTPLRIQAVSAHYDNRPVADRISLNTPSAPYLARVRANYRQPDRRQLRVLVYSYDYPQLTETYVDAEVDWLLRQGVDVRVFSEAPAGSPGKPSAPVLTGELFDAVRSFRPDIIHCHWLVFREQLARATMEFGIPVTFRGHGFEFSPEEALRCAGMEMTRAVYIYPHLAAKLPPHPRIQPLVVAYDSARMRLAPKRDNRLVLRTAACLETKDIDLFIRVAARCPGYRFVLVMGRVDSRAELPDHFRELNVSLGSPVDIRMNVQRDDVVPLMQSAGIYLHTFGFMLPFGMPISIAEALACGSVPVVRNDPVARNYAGAGALFYDTEDEVVEHLHRMLSWTPAHWEERAQVNARFARSRYADDVVLPLILENWRDILHARPGGLGT
ncbi:MAG: glycosyltransferase [Pseudomonadota bacterium]